MKINPDTQVKLTLPLLESTLDAYGVGLDTHEEVAEGISNTVVRITDQDSGEYYLKYYKTTHERDVVIREVKSWVSLPSLVFQFLITSPLLQASL